MTLRQIATSIMNELNEQYNHELYERLKDRIIFLRAKFLRQSIGKYGIDELLQQTYCVDLEKKTDYQGCEYYQTIYNVMTPIRAINSPAPYIFVGANGIPYTYLRVYETQTIPKLPINALHKYYSVINKKIKVYNSTVKRITITDVFENFDSLLSSCDDRNCYDDDTILPMPADFTDDIIRALVSELAVKPIETNEKVAD